MGEDPIWDRVAHACRYGHTGYDEAMLMPVRDLRPFQEAINRLVEGENRAAAGGND